MNKNKVFLKLDLFFVKEIKTIKHRRLFIIYDDKTILIKCRIKFESLKV